MAKIPLERTIGDTCRLLPGFSDIMSALAYRILTAPEAAA